MATIEYQLGNENKAREEFKKIYSSPFSYDLKTIYSNNEIGLTWYLIKELHINPNYCEEFKKTQRLFIFQDYMKYYEYKNDISEYWQNNPYSSNCGGGPYKYEEVMRDLITVYYCNGNQERAIELIKKSRNKYLNLENNDLPEEIDVFLRIIRDKYSEEEIKAEWSKSISSMEFKKSHWSILLFDNRIALSDKIKKEEVILNLSKETSSQNISELLSQTELFKRLIE